MINTVTFRVQFVSTATIFLKGTFCVCEGIREIQSVCVHFYGNLGLSLFLTVCSIVCDAYLCNHACFSVLFFPRVQAEVCVRVFLMCAREGTYTRVPPVRSHVAQL